MSYNKVCECCGLAVPNLEGFIIAANIPCSDLHIRCVRCKWPVAKSKMDEDGICETCKGKYRTKKK